MAGNVLNLVRPSVLFLIYSGRLLGCLPPVFLRFLVILGFATNPKMPSDLKSQGPAYIEDNKSVDKSARFEDIDDAILRAQGHEVALERTFTWLGATGLAVR